VRVGRPYYFSDQHVDVTVTLHGGKIAQKCDKLVVTLDRTRPHSDDELAALRAKGQENPPGNTTETLLTLTIPGTEDLATLPDSVHEFRLEVGLPLDEHALFADSHQFTVRATADIPGAVDPAGHADVKVLPPRPANPERGHMVRTGKLTPEAFLAQIGALHVDSNAAIMDPDADTWVIYFMNQARIVVAHGEVKAVCSLRDGDQIVRTHTNPRIKPGQALGKVDEYDVDTSTGGLPEALAMARSVVARSDADALYPEPFGNTLFAFHDLHVYRGT
jgi:hypothetical protein